MKKARICHHDKRVLLNTKCVEAAEFFDNLGNEAMDLDLYAYFDKYYDKLRKLIWCMKSDYPDVDMSPSDIDLLYKRVHMRD